MSRILRGACLVLILAAPACGGNGASTPTSPSTVTASPVTLEWSSTLHFRGQTSRTFEMTQAGTVTVTLAAAAVPESWEVGVGVGIPMVDGKGCALSASVRAPVGSNPQLRSAVDQGTYCVAVYDVGALTEDAGFSIRLVYP